MKRVYSLIGFAQKAGKVSAGTMAAKNSILRRRARILVMSNDISDRTREAFIDTCNKQKVPWLILGNKYELGVCVGKAYRVALTVNDENMTAAILNAIQSKGVEEISMGVVEWPK